MEPLTFIASSLAVWRISKIITEEEGPFMVFTHIRSRFPSDGKRGWIGRGLYCLWCISFWIGLITGLALAPVLWGILYGIAFSSMAIAIDFAIELLGRFARKQ